MAAQTLPQERPAGVETTDPVPVPVRVIDRLTCGVTVTRAKLAVQLLVLDLSVIFVVVVLPEHPPDQLLNVDPFAGVAVRAMAVYFAKLALQAVPQEMPAGNEVTVPLPVPFLVTVRSMAPACKGAASATRDKISDESRKTIFLRERVDSEYRCE